MHFFCRRDDTLTVKTKYLVYKGCKKNTHRLWKSNGEGRSNNEKTKSGFSNKHLKSNFFASGLGGQDEEKLRENIRTTEKMNQLKVKMELANARKKLKSLKLTSKSKKSTENIKKPESDEKLLKVDKPTTSTATVDTSKFARSLSAESKTRIKENLSRNRSFKTILTSSIDATTPSFFNNNVDTYKVCNKLGRSFSFQSNYVFSRNEDSPSQLATLDTASFANSPTVISETSEVGEEKCSTSMQDLLLKEFFSPEHDFSGSKCALNTSQLACTSGSDINEYFILPKFLVRKNSAVIDQSSNDVEPDSALKLLDVPDSIDKPVDFRDDLTSSSTSLLSKINEYSYFPALAPASNRFYHSDLDLNQISERFKNKLSFSHQEINSDDSDWTVRDNSRVHPSAEDDCEEKCLTRNLEEIKYDKFLNDLLSADHGDESLLFDLKSSAAQTTDSKASKTVGYKTKSSSSNQLEVDKPAIKTNPRTLPPLWSKSNNTTDKLKSFGSNPVLRTNLCANDNITLANSTTTVHIPQLSSRLEDIPLMNRRGYINLNDACLSNSGEINRSDTTDQKVNVEDDVLASRFNGRQSRFEYCRNNIFPSTSKSSFLNTTLSRKHSLNLDCQSEENIFNINIDSFYDDFVDSTSWSSSSSSESLESSCTSSLGLDKKFLLLPDIKLDQTELKTGVLSVDTITVESETIVPTTVENLRSENEQLELSGKLRCSKCRKKLGIVMVFKCHCEKYFCSTHRYSSTHDCEFDYKAHAREIIARENPLCVTEKLPKI